MDVSPEYIKFCEKAGEIQELFTEIGDNVLMCSDCKTRYGNCYAEHPMNPNKKKHEIIWLPRQDQLQRMVKSANAFELLRCFQHFWLTYREYNYETTIKFSMEQLWLSFIMKKKYNKYWDGNEWRMKE